MTEEKKEEKKKGGDMEPPKVPTYYRPRVEEKDADVKLGPQKQGSMDKAMPKVKGVVAEMDEVGCEKYKNEDLVKRLVAFSILLESGKFGVAGKSPAFILERFSACINASAPHVILDAPLKRVYEEYITQWLRVRTRV